MTSHFGCEDKNLGVGTVVVIEDLLGSGYITHRIVEVNEDRTYKTRGDADTDTGQPPRAGPSLFQFRHRHPAFGWTQAEQIGTPTESGTTLTIAGKVAGASEATGVTFKDS